MTTTTLALLSTLLVAATGCAIDEPGTESAEPASTAVTPSPSAHGGDGTAPSIRPPERPIEESIYDVKKPASAILDGAHVHIGGDGVRVTASAGATLFIQEAGDDGACERDASIVAYRAVEVTLAPGSARTIARGARVTVEGRVTTQDGRRTIVDATASVLDAPLHEYRAHCDRDSHALYDYALDAVLVTTAGTTDGAGGVADDGSWLLATCFGDAIRVGTRMASYEGWQEGWHWVSGIVAFAGDRTRVEPRDLDDVVVRSESDTCL